MADLQMAVVLTGEQAAKAGIAAITSETKSLIEATTGVSGAFKSATESASAFTAGVRTMAEAENALHVAAQNQITDLKAQKMALQDVGYQQAQKQIAALKAELNPEPVRTFSQTWQELASKYYLVSQAAQTASRTIMSLVDASSKYELILARMTAAEGSKALGDRDFKMVQEMAKKPGLGFEEAASTMATLRGMKITAGEAKQLIEGIAQANASAGGTAEQFGRVMYQIRQSIGYGKLMQEDLRPILEAVPTLGALIQEHFGSNQGEVLNKTLKESGKSVREFWLEVANMGAGMPSTGETIANNMDNIRDSWVRLKASLIDTGAVKAATAALGSLLDRLAIAMEKTTAEKSLRERAQLALGYGDNLTYYKNTGERNPQIEAKMKELAEIDRVNGLMVAAEKATGDARDRAAADAKKKREDAETEAAKAAKSEAKRMATHMRESAKNVEFAGLNEVTMRGGMEWATDDPEGRKSPWYERITGGEPDPEHAKNRLRADAKAEEREKNHREIIAEENRYSLDLLAVQRQSADAAAKEEESQYSYLFSLQSKVMQKRLAAESAFDAKESALRKKQAKDHAQDELASRKDPLLVQANLQHQIDKIDTDMSLRKIKRDQEVMEAKKKHWHEYADVVQSLSQKELSSALKGDLTKKQALEDLKNAAIDMISERTTKAIEGMLEEAIFGKATAATTAAVTATSMAAISAAAAPAAAGVSLATFGANSGPATAGIGSAYALTSSLSAFAAGMPHERGGAVFGRYRGNREEPLEAFVPSRVVPIQNSTTNNTSHTTNHYHFHGISESQIKRLERNASVNGSGSSRR